MAKPQETNTKGMVDVRPAGSAPQSIEHNQSTLTTLSKANETGDNKAEPNDHHSTQNNGKQLPLSMVVWEDLEFHLLQNVSLC